MKKGSPKTVLACKIFWWTLRFSPQTTPKDTIVSCVTTVRKKLLLISSLFQARTLCAGDVETPFLGGEAP
jgi:hypothetical protein